MTILIAGAGIGGLCAALCLQKSGHNIQIVERSKKLAEAGAGVQLGANALKVLDYLGLLEQIELLAVQPARVDFRAFNTGEILHSSELGETYLARYGAPYLHIHRADLQRVLTSALSDSSQLILNKSVVSFKEEKTKVSVKLTDGLTLCGDCLIGADGIRSNIRRQMLANAQPQFTGNVAWRGLVSADRLPADFMDRVVTNFVGPNKHMVIYYLRDQELVNFVGVVKNPNYQNDAWTAKSAWQDLKQDFSGWHPTIQSVIDAMDKDECYRWALYDHKPLNNWSSSRVTLLGDAAHATLPFLASGAAMAIEDGRVLQRAIDKFDSTLNALQSYQANRIFRTSKIQTMSRQAGRLYHIHRPMMLRLAFKAVKWKSFKTEQYLADYDANTVKLD